MRHLFCPDDSERLKRAPPAESDGDRCSPQRLHRHGGTTKGGDLRQSRSLGRGGRHGGCAAQNGRRRIQSGRIRRRVLKVPPFFSCRLQLKVHHLVCGNHV